MTRYLVIMVVVAGCGERAAAKSEILGLRERVSKLEASLKSSPEKPDLAPAIKERVNDEQRLAAAMVRAIDRNIAEITLWGGLEYGDFLDEHGQIKDLSVVATRIRDTVTKRNGGVEQAWRGLTSKFSVELTAAIMS